MSIQKIKPTGKTLKIKDGEIIISKTDMSGKITYANDTFIELSAFSKDELLGAPHNIIRHPDMPKALFYFMWDRINRGKNFKAVVKNITKNGDAYWVVTDFSIKKAPDGSVKYYTAFREGAPSYVVRDISLVYKEILKIEETQGMEISIKHFEALMDKKNMNYEEWIEYMFEPKTFADKAMAQIKKLC